jgi:hypothetical protein
MKQVYAMTEDGHRPLLCATGCAGGFFQVLIFLSLQKLLNIKDTTGRL